MKRYLLSGAVAVFAAAVLFTAPATGDNEYWTCGPGPSVAALVVPGGLEVTSVPPGARRLKVRVEQNVRGSGRHTLRFKTAALVLPMVIAVPSGDYVSFLASGKWTRAVPYPPLGCPSSPTLVP